MIDVPSSTWFTTPPHWQWLVALYFVFGGIAGGCYLLAAIIDLFGRPEDRPLARLGYYTVLPCLLASGALLIVDLGRPERFWHLFLESKTFMPLLKHWSPMSLGSWAMPAFSVFALLSFLGALAESGRLRWGAARRLRPPGPAGAAIAVIGAVLGLYMAGYTGVLLAVTNRPIWSDTPLLGMLLVLSAVSVAAAYMVLFGRARRWTLPGIRALDRVSVWAIALMLLVLIGVFITLGPAAKGWLNAWGALLVLGAAGLGAVAPLALHLRRDWLGERTIVASAALILLGGILLRLAIVFAAESIA